MAETAIVERIRKLMELADRAGTPEEAALAAQRTQELLQKYNLSLSEVEAAAPGSPDTPLTAKREKKIGDRGAMYKWQRDLMAAIARNNFCSHFVNKVFREEEWGAHERYVKGSDGDWDYSRKTRGVYAKAHVLIGRSENVLATQIMYDNLVAAMRRLQPFSGAERRTADACLWMDGCAEVLCERLDAKREEAERARESGSAQQAGLIRLADLYGSEEELNEDFRRGLEPGTTAKRRLEREAKEREIEAKEKELVEKGTDFDDAWYLARGMKVPPPTPETRTFASKRRASSSWSRSSQAWFNEQQREQARRANPNFRAGRAAGESIGLGGALKESGRKRIGDA